MNVDLRPHIDNLRDEFGYLVIHTLTEYCKQKGEEFEALYKRLKIDPKSVDLKLVINGEEMDLFPYYEQFASQMGRMVAEKAKDMLDDKFRDMNELMDRLQQQITEEARKRWPSFPKTEY